jgi:hypothetical protein
MSTKKLPTWKPEPGFPRLGSTELVLSTDYASLSVTQERDGWHAKIRNRGVYRSWDITRPYKTKEEAQRGALELAQEHFMEQLEIIESLLAEMNTPRLESGVASLEQLCGN